MARATARGLGTRRSILTAATGLASVEGLEGLSIGRLASELGMSKSGLFAHFGSKQELQLATIEAARQVYLDEVIKPGIAAERGLPRAWALCTAFLSYVERGVFPGGCFFASAMAEFDAQPGLVRDAIAEMQHRWMETLARTIGDAIECGEINAGTDPQLPIHTAAAADHQPTGWPAARALTSDVVSGSPPMPQSPLATSSTTTQVTGRIASPSISTIASVSFGG